MHCDEDVSVLVVKGDTELALWDFSDPEDGLSFTGLNGADELESDLSQWATAYFYNGNASPANSFDAGEEGLALARRVEAHVGGRVEVFHAPCFAGPWVRMA